MYPIYESWHYSSRCSRHGPICFHNQLLIPLYTDEIPSSLYSLSSAYFHLLICHDWNLQLAHILSLQEAVKSTNSIPLVWFFGSMQGAYTTYKLSGFSWAVSLMWHRFHNDVNPLCLKSLIPDFWICKPLHHNYWGYFPYSFYKQCTKICLNNYLYHGISRSMFQWSTWCR